MDTTRKKILGIVASTHALQSKKLIILERVLKLDNCIQGQILVGKNHYDTLELPYKNNQKNISSIPTGVYTFQKIKRSTNGKNALYIRGVENRTEILIHYGRKVTDTQGCILIENYERFHSEVSHKGLIVII